MKKTEVKKDQKSALIKGTERALSEAANFFMIPMCTGVSGKIKYTNFGQTN